MTDLVRIGATALYETGTGEAEVFLRWTPGDEGSIALDRTWADSGPPPVPGYYVFLLSVPPDGEASALETALRSALPAPTATGFAWMAWASGRADSHGIVPLVLDVNGQPTVPADVSLRLPSGVLQLAFAKGMVAAATRRDGLDGLVLTLDPPGPSLTGLRVPLLGALWGCVLLPGLLASPVDGDRSVKERADARLDPLRPFDPNRNRIIPLGERYLLRESPPGSYTLTPLS
ncbi:MAG TPA: hypothetical protein VIY52_21495 [Streptosporangiaceae bacterium]